MKNSKMITLLLVVAMALTACGPGTPKADPTQTLAAVYTAAAVTMTAQAAMATATLRSSLKINSSSRRLLQKP